MGYPSETRIKPGRNDTTEKSVPVVVAGAIIAAVFVTLVNLIVDLLYGWLDPRLRVN